MASPTICAAAVGWPSLQPQSPHPCIKKCATMATGLEGAAWNSQRCSEYSMSCHSSTPAAIRPAARCADMPAASARRASSAATGSHSSGTTHLHARKPRQAACSHNSRWCSGGQQTLQGQWVGRAPGTHHCTFVTASSLLLSKNLARPREVRSNQAWYSAASRCTSCRGQEGRTGGCSVWRQRVAAVAGGQRRPGPGGGWAAIQSALHAP